MSASLRLLCPGESHEVLGISDEVAGRSRKSVAIATPNSDPEVLDSSVGQLLMVGCNLNKDVLCN